MANFTVTGVVVESGSLLNTGNVVALISTDSAANVSFDSGSQVVITIDAETTSVASAVTYNGWQSANGFGGTYTAVDSGLGNDQVRISYAVADDALFKNDGNLGVAVQLQLDQGALFDSASEINDSGYVNFTVDQLGPELTSNLGTYRDLYYNLLGYPLGLADTTFLVSYTFDEATNFTGIPFSITKPGSAPTPTITQVSGGASGTTFTWDVGNLGHGDYTITANTANFTDSVGNVAILSGTDDTEQFLVSVDYVRPVGVVTFDQSGDQVANTQITGTVTFSEFCPVADSSTGAIVLTPSGATVTTYTLFDTDISADMSSVMAYTHATFVIDTTTHGGGNLSVKLQTGAIEDRAGNTSLVGANETIKVGDLIVPVASSNALDYYDANNTTGFETRRLDPTTSLVVTITYDISTVVTARPFNISGPVGMGVLEYGLNSGSLNTPLTSISYYVTGPSGSWAVDGTYTVDWVPANAHKEGNVAALSTMDPGEGTFEFIRDSTKATPVITFASSNLTYGQTLNGTVTFDLPVLNINSLGTYITNPYSLSLTATPNASTAITYFGEDYHTEATFSIDTTSYNVGEDLEIDVSAFYYDINGNITNAATTATYTVTPVIVNSVTVMGHKVANYYTDPINNAGEIPYYVYWTGSADTSPGATLNLYLKVKNPNTLISTTVANSVGAVNSNDFVVVLPDNILQYEVELWGEDGTNDELLIAHQSQPRIPTLATLNNTILFQGYSGDRLHIVYVKRPWLYLAYGNNLPAKAQDRVVLQVENADDPGVTSLFELADFETLMQSEAHLFQVYKNDLQVQGAFSGMYFTASIPLPPGNWDLTLIGYTSFGETEGTFPVTRVLSPVLQTSCVNPSGDGVTRPVDTSYTLSKQASNYYLNGIQSATKTSVAADTAYTPTKVKYSFQLARDGGSQTFGGNVNPPVPAGQHNVQGGGAYAANINLSVPGLSQTSDWISTKFNSPFTEAGVPVGSLLVDLGSIEVKGATFSQSNNMRFVAQIRADNGGVPGAVLATSDSIPASVVTSAVSFTNLNFTFSNSPVVLADAPYWMAVRLEGHNGSSQSHTYHFRTRTTQGTLGSGVRLISNTDVVGSELSQYLSGVSTNYMVPPIALSAPQLLTNGASAQILPSTLHSIKVESSLVAHATVAYEYYLELGFVEAYDTLYFLTDGAGDIVWQTAHKSVPVPDVTSYSSGNSRVTLGWDAVTPTISIGSPPGIKYNVAYAAASDITSGPLIDLGLAVAGLTIGHYYSGTTVDVGTATTYEIPLNVNTNPWLRVDPYIDHVDGNTNLLRYIRYDSSVPEIMMSYDRVQSLLGASPDTITPPVSLLISNNGYAAGDVNLSWNASTANNGNTVEYQVSWTGTASGSTSYQSGTTAVITLGVGTYDFSVVARVVEDHLLVVNYTTLTNQMLSATNTITPPGNITITRGENSPGNLNVSWNVATANNGNNVEYVINWSGTASGSATVTTPYASLTLASGQYSITLTARVVEDTPVTTSYTALNNQTFLAADSDDVGATTAKKMVYVNNVTGEITDAKNIFSIQADFFKTPNYTITDGLLGEILGATTNKFLKATTTGINSGLVANIGLDAFADVVNAPTPNQLLYFNVHSSSWENTSPLTLRPIISEDGLTASQPSVIGASVSLYINNAGTGDIIQFLGDGSIIKAVNSTAFSFDIKQSAVQTEAVLLTLPVEPGFAGAVVTNNGGGVLGWSSGGSSGGVWYTPATASEQVEGKLVYLSSNETVSVLATLNTPAFAVGVTFGYNTDPTNINKVKVLANDSVFTTNLTGVTFNSNPIAIGDRVFWTGSALSGDMPTGSSERVWQVGIVTKLGASGQVHVQVELIKVNIA